MATTRIIVFGPNHIGDVLFTTPALAALKAGHPEAEITVVAGRQALPVLEANPHVTEALERPLGPAAEWRLLRSLRTRRFQVSINFSAHSAKLAVWGLLLGCRERWGYLRPESRPFLSGGVREDPGRHWAEEYLALALRAGGQEVGRLPRVYLTEAERRWATDCREELGLPRARFLLGLHLGGSYPQKEWGLDRYLGLAKLAASRNARLVAFGGEREAERAERLAAGASDAVALAGRTTLRQFMALAACCTAFVGSDSGPTHLAAALGLPTVGLYGYTDPARFGVLGERAVSLGARRGPASYARRRPPTEGGWLASISPEEVWETLCRLTASSSRT